MSVSALMGKQVAELQQTVSLSLMQSQLATQTAHATVMMEQLSAATPAPHPFKGGAIDVKA